MEKSPEISVVILCYKSGEAAREFVGEVKELLEARAFSYELVLVANYNDSEKETDQTPRVVKEMANQDKHIVALTEIKQGMFGWDVRSGLEVASGETVAFIDGDGQMPPQDVIRVYDELIQTGSDMTQTFRVKRHDSLERIFISRVYNFLLRLLFPAVSVFDANSKPKIFTREALKKLKLASDDWFIDAEIVIQATENNLKVSQIPTVFLKNNYRPSFVNFSAVIKFLKNLIRYRFTQ